MLPPSMATASSMFRPSAGSLVLRVTVPQPVQSKPSMRMSSSQTMIAGKIGEMTRGVKVAEKSKLIVSPGLASQTASASVQSDGDGSQEKSLPAPRSLTVQVAAEATVGAIARTRKNTGSRMASPRAATRSPREA